MLYLLGDRTSGVLTRPVDNRKRYSDPADGRSATKSPTPWISKRITYSKPYRPKANRKPKPYT